MGIQQARQVARLQGIRAKRAAEAAEAEANK